jgi:hypothetical protein
MGIAPISWKWREQIIRREAREHIPNRPHMGNLIAELSIE